MAVETRTIAIVGGAIIGSSVAELIVEGGFTTLDLTPLGYERIRAGTPLRETVVY